MNSTPIIGFSAYSGTGKTTLIEKLIVIFKARGLRVGVIKHDAHDFTIDYEGKDSWRFSHAGADITLISSPAKTAVIEQRPRSFNENLTSMHDLDLIIAEGYQDEGIPLIALSRKATGKGLRGDPERFAAIVSDMEYPDFPGRVFGFDEVEAIADFVIELCSL